MSEHLEQESPDIVIVGDSEVSISDDGTTVRSLRALPPDPPRRQPGPPDRSPGLIDRRVEVVQVERWLDLGQPVRVTGPSGVGKSALLRELAARRHARGGEVVVLSGNGVEVGDLVQAVFEAFYDSSGYRPAPGRLRRLMGVVPGLVVIDDFGGTDHDLAQLLDALPATELLASQAEAPERSSQWHVLRLDGLGPIQARAVITRELARDLRDDEHAPVERYRQSVSGCPAALLQGAAAMRTIAAQQLTCDTVAATLAAECDAPARAGLDLLLALGGLELSATVITALAGPAVDAAAIQRLYRAHLVTKGPVGYRTTAALAGEVAERLELLPIMDNLTEAITRRRTYTRAMTRWVAKASAEEVARAAPAVVAFAKSPMCSELVPGLAQAAAPCLARTLRWDAWQTTLNRGLLLALRAHREEEAAYFAAELEVARRAAVHVSRGAAVGGAAAGQSNLKGARARLRAPSTVSLLIALFVAAGPTVWTVAAVRTSYVTTVSGARPMANLDGMVVAPGTASGSARKQLLMSAFVCGPSVVSAKGCPPPEAERIGPQATSWPSPHGASKTLKTGGRIRAELISGSDEVRVKQLGAVIQTVQAEGDWASWVWSVTGTKAGTFSLVLALTTLKGNTAEARVPTRYFPVKITVTAKTSTADIIKKAGAVISSTTTWLATVAGALGALGVGTILVNRSTRRSRQARTSQDQTDNTAEG